MIYMVTHLHHRLLKNSVEVIYSNWRVCDVSKRKGAITRQEWVSPVGGITIKVVVVTVFIRPEMNVKGCGIADIN